MIRVLIVDNSLFIRQSLTSMLDADPHTKVIGTANSPIIAREMIKRLKPDVLTLDIEMPEMNGLSFLEKIMALRPMRGDCRRSGHDRGASADPCRASQ